MTEHAMFCTKDGADALLKPYVDSSMRNTRCAYNLLQHIDPKEFSTGRRSNAGNEYTQLDQRCFDYEKVDWKRKKSDTSVVIDHRKEA